MGNTILESAQKALCLAQDLWLDTYWMKHLEGVRRGNGQMYILGIQGNFGRPEHDASAALIKDGEVLVAVEEERFIRYKHAFGVMPDNAIRYCLKYAGVEMSAIDIVAFPRSTWYGHEKRLNWYFEYNFGQAPNQIEFVHHPLSHAASAYYCSGFDNSLVLSADMTGDGISLALYRFSTSKYQLLYQKKFPDSLGVFMALITQYLGFRSSQDEGKIMGLAAYGKPTIDLSQIINISNGDININRDFLHPEVFKRYPEFHTRQLPFFDQKIEAILPNRRIASQPIQQHHKDIAASAQKILETAITAIIDHYREPSDSKFCFAGGIAQNSVLNGKLVESGWFEDIYIPPAVGDAGSALGAAIIVGTQNQMSFDRLDSASLGPKYETSELKQYLKSNNIRFAELSSPSEYIASALANHQVIALFQGRMEFGPRALGNRSLLAHPNAPNMKERVNQIKQRENFRPFAPSILDGEAKKLCEFYQYSPFMSFAFKLSTYGQSVFSEAMQIDGTARVQSINYSNGTYHDVISHFYDLTKIPGILNTSLNIRGEPIVCTPGQALQLFFTSTIDHLILGDFAIKKT